MHNAEKERERLRVAVVGAGAIGGVVAAFLARAGWDLEVVCKHQETVNRALCEGFHISGVRGEHRIPLRGVKEIRELSGLMQKYFFLNLPLMFFSNTGRGQWYLSSSSLPHFGQKCFPCLVTTARLHIKPALARSRPMT